LGFGSLFAGLVGCNTENSSEAARVSNLQSPPLCKENSEKGTFDVFLRFGEGRGESSNASNQQSPSGSVVFSILGLPASAFFFARGDCEAFASTVTTSITKRSAGAALKNLYVKVDEVNFSRRSTDGNGNVIRIKETRSVLCIVPQKEQTCVEAREFPTPDMLSVFPDNKIEDFSGYFPGSQLVNQVSGNGTSPDRTLVIVPSTTENQN
ncbi:MAG: hypothetical protein IOD12_11870, partial [Silvanigrellales bacterium]|nr:hypothetical protein [Silvanigrellales bacterium]